jgi:hypothetical protein
MMEGRKIMKLNLLLIAIDLVILLAYPIVLLNSKLRQFSRSGESSTSDRMT